MIGERQEKQRLSMVYFEASDRLSKPSHPHFLECRPLICACACVWQEAGPGFQTSLAVLCELKILHLTH
jgi:hypothetical protein